MVTSCKTVLSSFIRWQLLNNSTRKEKKKEQKHVNSYLIQEIK